MAENPVARLWREAGGVSWGATVWLARAGHKVELGSETAVPYPRYRWGEPPPGVSMEDWKQSVEEAAALFLEHREALERRFAIRAYDAFQSLCRVALERGVLPTVLATRLLGELS